MTLVSDYSTEFIEHISYLKSKFAFENTKTVDDIQDKSIMETLDVLYRVNRLSNQCDIYPTSPILLKNIVSWKEIWSKVILCKNNTDYLAADLPWFMCRYFERNTGYTPTNEEWYSYTYMMFKHGHIEHFYSMLKYHLNHHFYYNTASVIWQEYFDVIQNIHDDTTITFTEYYNFVLEVYHHIRTNDTIPLEYKSQILTNTFDNLNNPIKDIIPNIISISPRPNRFYVRTYDNMMRIVERITNRFITRKYLLENKGIALSGGMISMLLSNTEEDIDAYLNSYRPDIDIFIVSSDETVRRNALHSLIERTSSYRWHKRCFVAYKDGKSSIFYIFVKGAVVPLQIVVSNFVNEWDMMNAFDMTHLQLALKNGEMIATLPCILSQISYHTSIHPMMPVKLERLAKAINRQGYCLWEDNTVQTLYGKDQSGFYAMIETIAHNMNASVRKYPTRWKLRRFLRFVNGCSTKQNDIVPMFNSRRCYVGEYPWYFRNYYEQHIRVDGDFHGMLFSSEYGTTVPKYHTNYVYNDFPPIQIHPYQSLIETEEHIPLSPIHRYIIHSFPEHYFLFKRCDIYVVPDNDDLVEIRPDTFENAYMMAMFRRYLHRLLDVYERSTIRISSMKTITDEDVEHLEHIPVYVLNGTPLYNVMRSSFVRIFPYHVSYSTTGDTLEVYFNIF